MTRDERLKSFYDEIYSKTNSTVEKLLTGYFLFGIFLAFFYDTWVVAFGVGILCLVLYYGAKYIFKGKTVNQYVASLVLGIFMAQFIYQMHGLFEMHFTAFIAIIALMAYENILVFLPAVLFIAIHHATFAYVQYLGFSQNIPEYELIYFTQLDYMDLQTFLFHVGLVVIGVVLASIYAHNLRKTTRKDAELIIDLEEKEKRMEVNVNFANEIANANYDVEYELDENDSMGQALVNMRANLKESSERENQEKFSNVGLTKVADIIRNYSGKLEELSFETISFLVKYMKMNQGGLFVLNDENDEHTLKLMGCYAYERRKYLNKEIPTDQGLVGQCYLEKDVIYMKEVPDDYVYITSGLGDAPPSTLILVPIKNEDIIEGVIEMAGFSPLEDYQIQFLKEVGESIAMAINSTKINERTKILYETSQQQAEEMRTQEEEIRQNMEELSATQEEMERRQREMEEVVRKAEEKEEKLKKKLKKLKEEKDKEIEELKKKLK